VIIDFLVTFGAMEFYSMVCRRSMEDCFIHWSVDFSLDFALEAW